MLRLDHLRGAYCGVLQLRTFLFSFSIRLVMAMLGAFSSDPFQDCTALQWSRLYRSGRSIEESNSVFYSNLSFPVLLCPIVFVYVFLHWLIPSILLWRSALNFYHALPCRLRVCIRSSKLYTSFQPSAVFSNNLIDGEFVNAISQPCVFGSHHLSFRCSLRFSSILWGGVWWSIDPVCGQCDVNAILIYANGVCLDF